MIHKEALRFQEIEDKIRVLVSNQRFVHIIQR